MNHRIAKIAASVLLLTSLGLPGFLDARGLLGERYFAFSAGVERPGDSFVRSIDDSIFFANAGLNFPVDRNVDWTVGVGYAKAEGSVVVDGATLDLEATGFLAETGPVYHFFPDEQINPFVGATAGFARTKAEARYLGFKEEETETDFAFSVGGGVEILIGDRLAFTPSVGYYRIGNEDDVIAGIGGSFWVTDAFFVGARFSYGFDDGDTAVSLGAGFTY